MSSEIMGAVRPILAGILGLPESEIGPTSSKQNIPDWDSMRHVEIIFALERKFGVKFKLHEVPSLVTVQDILLSLEGKKVSPQA